MAVLLIFLISFCSDVAIAQEKTRQEEIRSDLKKSQNTFNAIRKHQDLQHKMVQQGGMHIDKV